MKYSIRKKMFLISMTTTMLGFLLILVCFNIICRNYIDSESSKALNYAVTTTEAMPSVIKIKNLTPAKQNSINFSINTVTSSAIVDAESVERDSLVSESPYLQDISVSMATSLQQTLNQPDVEFIVLDNESNSILYPDTSTLPDVNSSPNTLYSFYNTDEINALQQYVLSNDVDSPVKVKLNDVNYYVLETKLNDHSSAVFYKNVQPLDNLVEDVNSALYIILLLCAVITVSVTMGLSNGMIRSIQKLCHFANDIGAGNLAPQELNLKESELAVLEQDMNEMAKRLAEYDAEQKTFFQNVSHELRTPLMSIQGYAEGITSQVFEADEINSAANIILTESERLASMVENILFVSRIDTKNDFDKAEPFACLEIIKQCIEWTQTIAEDKNILLQTDGNPLYLIGNREEFFKAISNILTNCLRYAKTQIHVDCLCQEEKIQIIIRDDGSGIAEEDLPHIFKRFYKGKEGLSGIGLAISETVIVKHGGTIKAHNENGAVFTITFPHP